MRARALSHVVFRILHTPAGRFGYNANVDKAFGKRAVKPTGFRQRPRRRPPLFVVVALLVGLALNVGPHPRSAFAAVVWKVFVGDRSGIVAHANLDGTGGVSLGNLSDTIISPVYDMAIDATTAKMYVVTGWPNHIVRANLDGTAAAKLAIATSDWP